MGAALGGGAAESAFGSDTSNILTKGTIYGIIAFFLVALGLFLMYQSEASNRTQIISADELISAEKMAPAADTVVEESVVEGTAGTVVEDVVAIADDSAVTIEALVESVEVVAPVVDADASSVETVPTSN